MEHTNRQPVTLVLSLLLGLIMTSCATVNHGATVPGGHVQVQLTPGVMLNNLDLRYGVTDDLTVGAAVDTGGLVPVQVDGFVLYRFRVEEWILVPGVGAKLYGVQNEILPTASLAISRTWDQWRPYAGVSADLKRVQPFVGVEQIWGSFSLFAQLDAIRQLATVGSYDPGEGSVDVSIRPNSGDFGTGFKFRPTAGVTWQWP